jgi:hypothetical protein
MDIVTIILEAKRMGLDLTQILMFATVYFLLRKDLVKVMDRQFDKLIVAINSLEKTHNDRLNRIENHIGLKKDA